MTVSVGSEKGGAASATEARTTREAARLLRRGGVMEVKVERPSMLRRTTYITLKPALGRAIGVTIIGSMMEIERPIGKTLFRIDGQDVERAYNRLPRDFSHSSLPFRGTLKSRERAEATRKILDHVAHSMLIHPHWFQVYRMDSDQPGAGAV
jgi:hypothetical protein